MRDAQFLPVVSLLLILCLVAVVIGAQPRGLWVKIPVWRADGCGDGDRIAVVRALTNGRVLLNTEEMNLQELGAVLHEVFRERTERVAFLTADDDTPFGNFVRASEVAKQEADYIALMLPSRNPAYFCYSIPMPPPICGNSAKPTPYVKEVPLFPWD